MNEALQRVKADAEARKIFETGFQKAVSLCAEKECPATIYDFEVALILDSDGGNSIARVVIQKEPIPPMHVWEAAMHLYGATATDCDETRGFDLGNDHVAFLRVSTTTRLRPHHAEESELGAASQALSSVTQNCGGADWILLNAASVPLNESQLGCCCKYYDAQQPKGKLVRYRTNKMKCEGTCSG